MRNLNPSGKWPSGNVRYYYRPKGQKGIAMPDLPPDHPRFVAAWTAAAAKDGPALTGWTTGSTGAAITAYLASDAFLSLSRSTREDRRRIADKLRQEYGTLPLAGLRTKHIRLDVAKGDPHPANNRRKVWRHMGRFWEDAGLVEDDPARDVRARAKPPTDGYTPWDRDDVATFRRHWPIGTPQRLAMELMHRTCASIGDACTFGPNMIRDGWLVYRRMKSRSEAVVPMTAAAAPPWFEHDDYLAACIAKVPLAMTFLATAGGRPRSVKAASQWFSSAATEAGLGEVKAAHGIRKHRAAVFRENGASEDQRMAILGHETNAEAKRYSRSADLRRVITGTEISNPSPTSLKLVEKS